MNLICCYLQEILSLWGSLSTFCLSVICRRSSWTSLLTCTSDSSGQTTDSGSMDQTSTLTSWWWGRSTSDSSGCQILSLSMRRSQRFTKLRQKTNSCEYLRVEMCCGVSGDVLFIFFYFIYVLIGWLCWLRESGAFYEFFIRIRQKYL